MHEKRFLTSNYQLEQSYGDAWVDQIIFYYHQYLRTVLLNPLKKDEAEETLKQHLAHFLQVEMEVNLDALEHIIEEGFRERGYYFLGGVTPPFRGPYIWKNMETLQFDVELPGTIQPVTVHMMYDFIMESWIGFATCEQKHVGGWSKEDGIYCNAICYENREGEDFHVSYLKHEAQHFYDQNHFPDLQSVDLEYRAKLVELIYRKDHTILRKFFLEAKNNPAFPHPYAAYLIIQQLSERLFKKGYEGNWDEWLKIDYNRISSISLELYKENTEELKKLSDRTSV